MADGSSDSSEKRSTRDRFLNRPKSSAPQRRTPGLVLDDLFELAYQELRLMARAFVRKEKGRVTLQPTALVHEAYVKLSEQGPPRWESPQRFLAVAGRAMRQVLVDEARRRGSQKRGGAQRQITFVDGLLLKLPHDPDVLDLETSLERLEQSHPRAANIVQLRFFAGLSNDEVADELGLSTATVTRDWRYARAWLYRRLADPAPI